MARSNNYNNNSDHHLLTDLIKCVSVEALKKENIQNYDLKIYGTEDKIQQYGSDIAYIDICAENFDATKREYNLVLKYGHIQKNIRNKLPIHDGFSCEIEVYNKLVPRYNEYLKQKNQNLLNIIPKCYLTKFTDTDQIIVLENLKKKRYRIYNRKVPMNIQHIKLVLEAYAQWHALSFCLEDQRDQKYLEIKQNFIWNPWKIYLNNQLGEMIDFGQSALYSILEENGENDLLCKYKQKLRNVDARTILMDLMNAKENFAVILHGDSWNNNFLFQYDDEGNDCQEVALLDFQFSSWKSPVFDLSHFIYAVASEEELKEFRTLLDYYYLHLAKHIKNFGNNPEKLFSFKTLKTHWEKYCAYGAVLSPFIAMYCFIDKEDTTDFGVFQTMKNITMKPEYMKRVIAVTKHFVEFEF